MSYGLIKTINSNVLELTLDRPKANAIDPQLSQELGKAFAEYRDNPELQVAILTGAGEQFFTAGWDLNGVADGEDFIGDYGEGGFCGFTELKNLYKPVICAVNGLAVGAGLEMLLRADFVIAADHAEFMLPEVRRGFAPDIATIMLPKLLPRPLAMEMLMTGRRFSAHKMASFGLINEVVPAPQLMDAARKLANDLLKASPLSLAAIKEAVQITEKMGFHESFESLRSHSWPLFMQMLQNGNSQEGAAAFLEKRQADFSA